MKLISYLKTIMVIVCLCSMICGCGAEKQERLEEKLQIIQENKELEENLNSTIVEKKEEESVHKDEVSDSSEESVASIEMSEECREIYSQIIESVEMQETDAKIYFREKVFSSNVEVPVDDAGGVSVGYTLTSTDMLYYLEDISNEADGNPELFIGVHEDSGIKLLAIYSYDSDEHMAFAVSTVDDEYNPEIYLCKGGMFLEGNTSGGEFIMLSDAGRIMPFSAFRKDQDEERIIDTNTIEWSSVKEW